MLSVARDANGFTVVTPGSGSHVIYVAAGADDAAAGTSPAAATSLAHGLDLMRDGFPYQMLLRRGDSFTTPLTQWSKGGRSAVEPMVIGAYSDPAPPSAERPKILSGLDNGFSTADAASTHGQIDHLYLLGVAFEASQRNYRQPPFNFTTAIRPDPAGGTYGIRSLGQLNDFQVEDCSFQYYRTGIALSKYWGTFSDVRIRRNLIADNYVNNYDPATGKASVDTFERTSEGVYAEFVNGLSIEENVVDQTAGWTPPTAGWGPWPASTTTTCTSSPTARPSRSPATSSPTPAATASRCGPAATSRTTCSSTTRSP